MADSKLTVIVDLVDKLSQPIKEVKKNFDDLGKKAKSTQNEITKAFDKGRTDVEAFRTSAKQVGAGLTAVGAGLAFGLKQAVDVASEFEFTLSGLQAVSGATADEMARLRQQALDVGASTSKSANDVALAQEMLAKNGMDVIDMLDGATEATVALSEATGGELAGAADIMTDVMAIFGKESKDLENVINGITGVTVKSKFTIDDFRLALAQGGGVAGAVGVTMEDFNTTIAAIAPSFASGSDAGTSFKVLLQRLVPQGKPATEMMRQLGIITEESGNRFFDAEGNMKSMSEIAGILQESMKDLSDEQRNMALSTLFGTDAMRAGAQLAKVGSEGFDDLAKSIQEVDAAAQAAERLNNLNGAMEELKGAAETAMITIGAALIPTIKWFAELIGNVVNVFNGLPEPLQKGIAMFGALAAAFALIAGPILMFIGFIPMIKAGALAIATVVGGVSLPFVAVAVAIGVVVALIIAYWDEIKAVTIATWEAVKNGVIGAWEAISSFIMGIVTSIGEFLSTAFALWLGIVITIFESFGVDIFAVFETIKQVILAAWEAIKTGVSLYMEFLKNIFKTGFNAVVSFLTPFGEAFMSGFSAVWSAVTGIGEKAVDTMKNTVLGVLNWIIDKINLVVKALNHLVEKGANKLPGVNIKVIPEVPKIGSPKKNGGFVQAGTTYPVGEVGPELFTPQRSGYIIPNNKMSGGVNVVVNVGGNVATERDLAESIMDIFTRELKLSNQIT